jgi:manganese oxidase
MSNRRKFFRNVFGAGAGIAALSRKAEAQHDHQKMTHDAEAAAGAPVPVITPDVPDLPFTLDNGVKVFHLIAEPVKREIAPGKVIDVWGFNGSCPGPTFQITEGDRVRVVFDNKLPEATSIHWHGFEIPIPVDGMPGVSQEPVKPGGRFVYEFTLNQSGTFFYHSHMAMQEMLGMLGAFIMHPKAAPQPAVQKDFVIMLQEYAVLPNNSVPDTMKMEFNWLVFNGKAGPAITPPIVKLGERVRIRLINLGMDHHPIHLHGNTFYTTGTEAGRIPQAMWMPGNTVLVGVAQARDIEFEARYPGDWMIHCHLPHHMMNQMVSSVGPMTRAGAKMMSHQMAGMDMEMSVDVSPDANKVPGFPQDAYMESPMMAMDDKVKKPQNFGLAPGWSGYTQGMMTYIRVLPPDKYEQMVTRIREGKPEPDSMPGMIHHPGNE